MSHSVKCIPTAAHAQLFFDGVQVAETQQPLKVVETNHPDRYYFPQEDVDKQYLTPTATQTHCPYKGDAGYYTVTVNGEAYVDVAWHYDEPIVDVPELKGTIAFWTEKDARIKLLIDGETV